jgi:hypothetical protein
MKVEKRIKMAHPNKGATKRDAPKMEEGPLEVKKEVERFD